MKKPVKSSPEVRERAVRMVLESQGEHPSQWSAIESIAAKIGCASQTLHGWLRRHERDAALRGGPTTAEQQRLKELELEAQNARLKKMYAEERLKAEIVKEALEKSGEALQCEHARGVCGVRN